MEKTLAIIKPDAVKAKNIGNIIARIEQEGFNILAMKMKHLSKTQTEAFYAIHKGKGFFEGLTTFMASGPVVALALAKPGAILAWRDLMGATNPANAAPNTLRKLYGASIDYNATHGSDAPETAAEEIKFFFPNLESGSGCCGSKKSC